MVPESRAVAVRTFFAFRTSFWFLLVRVLDLRIGLDVLSVGVISVIINTIVVGSILYFFGCAYHI